MKLKAKPSTPFHVAALILGSVASACASDFRVVTTVASPDGRHRQKSTTLFHERRVYDFDDAKEGEVMIVNLESRELTLLAPMHRDATTVSIQLLEQLAKAVATEANAERHQPIVRFAARPDFAREWDPAHRQLTLNSRLLTYSTKIIEPEDTTAIEAYRTFADVSAQLATLSPGMPAQARLELNRELAAVGGLPIQVAKTIDRQTVSSAHRYAWQLNAADVENIAQFEDWANSSDKISFMDYLGKYRP